MHYYYYFFFFLHTTLYSFGSIYIYKYINVFYYFILKKKQQQTMEVNEIYAEG